MANWYHGSPMQLDTLAVGSTITMDCELARIFASRPSIVCWDDDGRRRHNGTQPGYLYAIDEVVATDDVVPHPRSTMPAGAEWLTQRPLRVRPLGVVMPRADELLSPDEVAALMARVASGREPGT